MRRWPVCCLVFLALHPFLRSQSLTIFEPLLNRHWYTEENWENGGSFKQDLLMQYALDSSIIIVKSNGYTNQEKTTYGPRNHGIRRINSTSGKIEFHEFDVFGGLATGEVQAEGKDLFYMYEYNGLTLTDHWAFVNDSTYEVTIGVRGQEEWEKVFLEATYKGVLSWQKKALMLMTKKLPGHWESEAWDGRLLEKWYINDDLTLAQSATYVEGDDILYQAQNQVQLIHNELILTTIIQDGQPKIFKGISFTAEQVVFENTDYENPSKLVYDFGGTGFKRTIRGLSNGQPTQTIFDFRKNDQ